MPGGKNEFRARRRPFVIAAAWLLKVGAAYALAAPFLRAVQATGVAERPGADSELFVPGGLLLVETLRLARPDLILALTTAALVAPFALLVAELGLAALMTAIATPGRLVPERWASRTLVALPRFIGLGVAFSLAQGGLAFACIGPTAGLFAALDGVQGGAYADAAFLFGILVGSVSISAVGLIEDLARALVVVEQGSVVRSIGLAIAVFRKTPLRLAAQWLARSALVLPAILLAALAVDAVDVSRTGAWRWLVALAIHQTVLLLATALRASWLARALGAVSSYDRAAPASR
ncbi:MAG TPA: hypothetical protein VF989_15475 [Polyangiaceae bacterium]|jgi:hypothetical protein